MPDKPYNILLITSDHHRGDCLSILDHPMAHTPHLDKLAQQGVLFRRAYAECLPARMSVMSGRRPGTDEGSMGYNYYRECSPLLPAQTLPGVLSEEGYQCQAVGKMHFFPQRKRYGFHDMILDEEGRRLPGLVRDDYEQWLQDNGFGGEDHSHGVANGEMSARAWHLPERAHPTSWTAREACRWVNRRDPGSPFFLWLSFSAPHPPFTPPRAYRELFRDIPVPEPRSGDWCAPERLPAEFIREQVSKNSDRLTGRWYAETVRAFHALITQIDFQISLVVGMLRERGLLDSTVILYTADHGDMMGDFGTFMKRVFYEGSANVPFILVLPPGHPDRRCGLVSRDPVGLQDVLPTLIDAAGLNLPGGITGVSALAGLRDRSGARELVHGDYTKGPETRDASHMLTDGHMKYIWYNEGDIEHLFDLERDPEERVNLAADRGNAAIVSEWRRRLVSVLQEEMSPDVRDGKLVSLDYPEMDLEELRSQNKFNPRGMHY